MKTTIKYDGCIGQDGETLRLQIGEKKQDATKSDGSFAVESGQLAFAPGSSGWVNAQGDSTCWMEIFLRGGNAWGSFNCPSVGTPIQISKGISRPKT